MGVTAPKVLVVDDELFFREAIRDILSAEGFDVELVEDGEAAIDAIQDARIGVVVLDIRLPGIDGIEVLGHVRKLRPDARVIMLSAHTDQELVLEALRGGACDYLAKPLHDEELALSVRRASEAFHVEDQWTALRTRLDRLAEHLGDLAAAAKDCDPLSRESVLWDGAVMAAADVLAARKASLLWLDEDGDELVVVATEGHEIDPADMDPVAVGERIAGIAFQVREPLVIADIETDPRFRELANSARYATGSCAVAPLEAGSRCLGVLCVADRHGGQPFGSEDAALMRLLALQIAELVTEPVASPPSIEGDETTLLLMDDDGLGELSQDELLTVGLDPADTGSATTQDLSPPSEIDDRDAEIARRICDAIASEVEPDRVLEAALAPIAEGLRSAPVSLYLLDASRRALELEAECDGGLRSDRPLLSLVTAGRGLTAQVVESGQLMAAVDPAGDPRFDPDMDAPADGVAGPFLCLPLSLRGKVVGVVRIFADDPSDVSARTGEVLSSALSAAIRNVLLYRSLVATIDEVAEARREARGNGSAGS